jgi:hypothetical protein
MSEGSVKYVYRHGRRIEVETLAPVRSRRKKGGLFSIVPLDWIGPAAKAAGDPAAVVLVYLKHLEWKHGPTFTLPNEWLKRAGVSRDVKRRVLRDLEAADIIAVKRWPRRSPQITMLSVA